VWSVLLGISALPLLARGAGVWSDERRQAPVYLTCCLTIAAGVLLGSSASVRTASSCAHDLETGDALVVDGRVRERSVRLAVPPVSLSWERLSQT